MAVDTAVADMEVMALVAVVDTSAATILEDSLEVIIPHQMEFRIIGDLHTLVMVAGMTDMAVATPVSDLDLEVVGITHQEP